MRNVRRRTFQIAASVFVVIGLSSLAVADGNGYNSENDIYVQVDNAVLEQIAAGVGVGALGAVAFEAQEGAHELLGDSSGQTVDHYYIWLCVGNECVPIDPFEFGG